MLKLAWKYMRYYKSQTFAIFTSILLTAALLSGISSLLYSSQKSDLVNSKAIYGQWHYYFETEEGALQSVQNGEDSDGYHLEKCGRMEIRDVIVESFPIYFMYGDDTYRSMAQRDIVEGNYPEQVNEIAADIYTLSNLGFSGNLGDFISGGSKKYVVTGVLKSEWAAGVNEMELFVSNSFVGRGSQLFLYLQFEEEAKLYKQLNNFQKKHQIRDDIFVPNTQVIQYLGGERPDCIYDIVKFGLTEEEGNFTYIILKLQSDYNLVYKGMILLLSLFSLFVVYSVFHISVSKRTSEYGIMQTLGISEKRIGGTLILELWMLFLLGYPIGCLIGTSVLKCTYNRFGNVFATSMYGGAESGTNLSVADQTLTGGAEVAKFYIAWDAICIGFVFLLIMMAFIGFLTIRSLRNRSLKEVMSGDTSFMKRRKIYAVRQVNMVSVVVRKFMFSNKRKVIGILMSLSIGGCIFLCTTYMVENLKVHAELSLKSDDGLGSEYRISLKSTSLTDTIPEMVADQIRNIPHIANVYATKFTVGELKLSKAEFLFDEGWRHYFDEKNTDRYYTQRFDGACVKKNDGSYEIKYDVYGYDDGMVKQLDDYILQGKITLHDVKEKNQIIAVANKDGQGNYYFYGKQPGDMITLRVPKEEVYTEELLKFQSGEENYIEKEFEIAAIISRSMAKEQNFLNIEPWNNSPSIIMTNAQMLENFGIRNYSFINASPEKEVHAEALSNQILQTIKDVPKAVLQDYTKAIQTQKNYLRQQQLFFSGIAIILLVISLFHIVNSMNYSILARRREYGIMRAMGITDVGFYKMILGTGIIYGILANVLIFLVYNILLRRIMDYYMTHVVQFLHLTAGVPKIVLAGIMVINLVIAVVAVMIPARKLVNENIISEIAR